MAEESKSAPAAPAAAAQKQLISPAMKELFAQIQEQQKRLAWSDAKLCEFATQTLGLLDPYKKLKVASVAFLQRLRVGPLGVLLSALRTAR